MMVARTSIRPFVLSILLLGALVLGAAACASPQTVPQPDPMPAGKSFSGIWYSPQFEHMHLRQSGDQVSGIYTYKQGGRIEGTVEGNLLVIDWIEPGSKEEARRTMKGKAYLQLVPKDDEAKLVGEWGYNEKTTGGGPWTAEYVRELQPGDPLTLKELQEQRD